MPAQSQTGTPTKLQKLHKFLIFYHSLRPKEKTWAKLTHNRPLEEHVAVKIVDDIWIGIEDLDWTALD